MIGSIVLIDLHLHLETNLNLSLGSVDKEFRAQSLDWSIKLEAGGSKYVYIDSIEVDPNSRSVFNEAPPRGWRESVIGLFFGREDVIAKKWA